MPQPFNQAQFIADRFGGRRALAEAIDVKPKTVDYWCSTTTFIPEGYRGKVLWAAECLEIDVTPYDFIRHLVQRAA